MSWEEIESKNWTENVYRLLKEISVKRNEIKEEFCKAYLAHLLDKFTVDEILEKIEMVEVQSLNEVSWHFRIKDFE